MKRFRFQPIALLVLCSCFSLSGNASLSSKDIQVANKAAEIMIPSLSEFLGKPVKLMGISQGDSLPENRIDIPNAVCNDYLLVANYMELYRMSFSFNFGAESYKDFKNPVANAIKTLDWGASSQHSECLMKEKGWNDELEVADYMMENLEKIMENDKRFNKLNDFDISVGIEETIEEMFEAVIQKGASKKWNEIDEKSQKKRQKILDKLAIQISSENPKPIKIPKPVTPKTPYFEEGDVLAVEMPEGYGICFVSLVDEGRRKIEYHLACTRALQKNFPTMTDFLSSKIACKKINLDFALQTVLHATKIAKINHQNCEK